MSIQMVQDTAAAALAITSSVAATSSGRRLPTRSDSGPQNSCPTAMPIMNEVIVS